MTWRIESVRVGEPIRVLDVCDGLMYVLRPNRVIGESRLRVYRVQHDGTRIDRLTRIDHRKLRWVR